MKEYTKYRFSKLEYLQAVGIYLVLDSVISILFYNSFRMILLLLPGFFPFLMEYRKMKKEQREKEMKKQFLDGIQLTAGALQAGYSIENAFREGLKELKKIYEPDSFIVSEFKHLAGQIGMNRNAEELLVSLGRRSGIDEIRSFADVFETTKRTGGDLMTVISNTVSSMKERQETLAEIETNLSGKVMEHNVMSLMPVLILAYVRLTSPEFLDPMYGNSAGIVIMTISLLVYLTAWLWGRSIVRIEV